MELPEVLRHLESNQSKLVEEAKKKLHEQFNNTKETWLVNGLVEYFVNTNSTTCVDVLAGVREPHDRHLFDRLLDSLRNAPAVRASMLKLLGHVVFRQPTWLYKISQHSLLREMIRLLKTETDMIILMTALLTLVILLPMIPASAGPYLPEIFEVFSRLAAWNTNNPNKLLEEQLIHLQVGLHALFIKLYGMYPCNFLSFMRNEYSLRENLGFFSHTINPMLATVKLHPLLVTASKDSETTTTRWKSMEQHDVVMECARLAVDSRDDANAACFSSFRPRSESDNQRWHLDAGPEVTVLPPIFKAPLELNELWSPSSHCGLSTPPESSQPTSIPHTPIAQSYVLSSSFPNQEGTSPPEAAIEATPETTPVKDSRHYVTRPPPVNSTVVRALNNLGGTKWSPTSSTPSQSQPSSPMKKEISPFRFPDNHGDSSNVERRKDSLSVQKLHHVLQERLSVSSDRVGMSSPNSPAPTEHYSSNNGFRYEEAMFQGGDTQEDLEVLEISQQGEQLCIDSTPTPTGVVLRHCDSVLQDYHPLHDSEIEDCQQESGSPCNSGGLHMPNSKSMLDFRQRVHRWRYYSQCCPDAQFPSVLPVSGSFKDNVTMLPTTVRRAHSCPDMKKDRPAFAAPDRTDLDESLELDDTITEGRSVLTNGATSVTTVSNATQTEAEGYPYEFLFLGVFPPVDQSSTQGASTLAHRSSPTTMLDRYIEIAAGLSSEDASISKKHTIQSESHNPSTMQSLEAELKTVKEQLILLHLQLKFERHRREVHAERNRRLLGKSRNNRWLEEHNSALRDQLALLERDIDSLHSETGKLKHENRQMEQKQQERIKHWQEKTDVYEKHNRELTTTSEELLTELVQTKQKLAAAIKDKQQVESRLFTVCSELKEATAQASAGEQLKTQTDFLQKELIVMGEFQQRYKERIGQLMLQNVKSNMAFQNCYLDEVRTLNQTVEGKTSALEAAKNRVSELETQLGRKDMLVAEQKRALEAVKEQCQESLDAVEAKFRSQVALNRRLEEHILELYTKLEASSKRSKRSVSTAQDVLSLAERGGMNSPMSLSLSSSEGMSMSSFVAPEMVPPRDLQSIVDETDVKQIRANFDDLQPPK